MDWDGFVFAFGFQLEEEEILVVGLGNIEMIVFFFCLLYCTVVDSVIDEIVDIVSMLNLKPALSLFLVDQIDIELAQFFDDKAFFHINYGLKRR